VDVDAVAQANRGQAPPPPEYRPIVPTAENEAIAWRYTTEKPVGDEWFKVGFDASAWKEGPGGFGTEGTPGTKVRTEWKTGDIWMRREFALADDVALKSPLLMLHHDEDAEVYVNGVLAARVRGFTTAYEEYDLSAEARATLKPGRNTIAVHCRQTGGGQYIDVGIVDVK
jgi:hypothetical protein